LEPTRSRRRRTYRGPEAARGASARRGASREEPGGATAAYRRGQAGARKGAAPASGTGGGADRRGPTQREEGRGSSERSKAAAQIDVGQEGDGRCQRVLRGRESVRHRPSFFLPSALCVAVLVKSVAVRAGAAIVKAWCCYCRCGCWREQDEEVSKKKERKSVLCMARE